jgi:hypothetical protein
LTREFLEFRVADERLEVRIQRQLTFGRRVQLDRFGDVLQRLGLRIHSQTNVCKRDPDNVELGRFRASGVSHLQRGAGRGGEAAS